MTRGDSCVCCIRVLLPTQCTKLLFLLMSWDFQLQNLLWYHTERHLTIPARKQGTYQLGLSGDCPVKIVIQRLVEVDWSIIQNIDIFVYYGVFPFTIIHCLQIDSSSSRSLSVCFTACRSASDSDRKTGTEPITRQVRQKRWKWSGHVALSCYRRQTICIVVVGFVRLTVCGFATPSFGQLICGLSFGLPIWQSDSVRCYSISIYQ